VASTILNPGFANNGASVTICSTSSSYGVGNITVPSSYTAQIVNGGSAWSSITTSAYPTQPTLNVSGDGNIEGNLTVGGKDIAKSLEAIEKRLAILVPDIEKLEHFEALKKAYEHYKLLEALCQLPKKEEN
jgi:hypothetical protein